jgi:hypothetical protein
MKPERSIQSSRRFCLGWQNIETSATVKKLVNIERSETSSGDVDLIRYQLDLHSQTPGEDLPTAKRQHRSAKFQASRQSLVEAPFLLYLRKKGLFSAAFISYYSGSATKKARLEEWRTWKR